MTSKVNLLGMTEARMRDYVQSLGEKPFRAKQLLKWVHQFGVDDFSSMTDFQQSDKFYEKEIKWLIKGAPTLINSAVNNSFGG